MGHDHAHASAGVAHRGRLLVVLGITTSILIVELIGAWLSGSLALLADAGHMFTDVAGLSLSVFAIAVASRPATAARTYGYYRIEILAAVANAVGLLGIGALILFEAWRRWQAPPEVAGTTMLGFAAIGMAANVVSLFLLRGGAKQSLNLKGAYLEVLGDLLGSLAVIVAAGVMLATGWQRADALASVAVALMIVPRTITLLREATDVLLEAAPRGVDMTEVRKHILEVPGVVGAHDLHAWTITSGMPVLSVHVVVESAILDAGGGGRVLDALGECLADHFDIAHSTFQLEPPEHLEHEARTHS